MDHVLLYIVGHALIGAGGFLVYRMTDWHTAVAVVALAEGVATVAAALVLSGRQQARSSGKWFE